LIPLFPPAIIGINATVAGEKPAGADPDSTRHQPGIWACHRNHGRPGSKFNLTSRIPGKNTY